MFTAAIARHLDTLGMGVHGRSGATIFLDDLPATPAAAMGVYALAGAGDTEAGHPFAEPGFQIILREDTTAYRPGYEKIRAIRDALHGLSQQRLAPGTPDEVWVVQILATGEPVNLGDDASNRGRWSQSFSAEIYDPRALAPGWG